MQSGAIVSIRAYLVSRVVSEPPLQVCGVETRDEAAALQRAEISRRSRSCADDIVEGELQGRVVLVSSLMLRGDTTLEARHVVDIHVSLIKRT